MGGLDSLHAPNDPTLRIGRLSRTVATSAPPTRTPLPGPTENPIGTPAWLPVQTIFELEQMSLATVKYSTIANGHQFKRMTPPLISTEFPASTVFVVPALLPIVFSASVCIDSALMAISRFAAFSIEEP